MTALSGAWALMRRQPLLLAAAVLLVFSSLLAAVAGRMAYVAAHDAQQALDELEADRLAGQEARCLKDDEDNAKIRRSIIDGGLIIGIASGNALLKTVTDIGRELNPAHAATYRANLEAIRPELEALANTFPAYRWDAEAETCVEVPLDTGG